jgi:hypothetical protein
MALGARCGAPAPDPAVPKRRWNAKVRPVPSVREDALGVRMAGYCSRWRLSEDYLLLTVNLWKREIVASRKIGRVRMCELRSEALTAAQEWLERERRIWASRLD